MDGPKKGPPTELSGRVKENLLQKNIKSSQSSQALPFPFNTQIAAAEHRRAVEKFDREGGLANYVFMLIAGERYRRAFREELRR